MSIWQRLLFVLPIITTAGACVSEDDIASGDDAALAETDQGLYVDGDHTWPRPARIPVCFEPNEPGTGTARQWTRDAVASAWSRVAHINFYGWGLCTSSSRGIRIRWADENPRTSGLGTELDGDSGGMTLNYKFATWSPSCATTREFCIKAIAVHEFGHALGFAHEQNRPDTPGWCDQEQGSDGTFTIGPWDRSSIMNYCSVDWNNNGMLSNGDIAGVQKVYGRKPVGSITVASGRCLDLRGGTYDDGTTVQVYDCVQQMNERFHYDQFSRELETYEHAYKVLAAPGEPDGTFPVKLATANGSAGQKFDFTNVQLLGDGGRCVDVPSGTTVPGTQVQSYPCNGGTNQRFTYNASRELRTPTGMCLGFSNSTLGAPLQIQKCTGSSLQHFQFQHGGLIKNDASSLCVAPNATRQLYAGNCTTSDNARLFSLRGPIHAIYGLCMEASGMTTGNITYLNNCTGLANQELEYYP